MKPKLARRLVKPNHCTHPVWVETYGPEVCEISARAGLPPDPQQEHVLDALFGIQADGRPSEFAHGVIACRQNLKTGVFKMAVTGWLVVTQQHRIVWSAHEMSTTLEAHGDLATMWEDAPFLSSLLKPGRSRDGIKANNNEASIELVDDQKVKFKARTLSGARGLTGDKVILDEAFALKPSMMGAMLPIMTTKPHAQVVYGSSAGKAESAVLRDIRDRGRSGSSPRLGYDEWLAPMEQCADPHCLHPKDALARGIDCALDREYLIRAANPTITTGRIDIQTLRDLRQELPPEEFARECLGWWDEDDGAATAIDPFVWGNAVNLDAPQPTEAEVVIDVAPDRSFSSVGVAGAGSAGKTLVIVRRQPGTAWVADFLDDLQAKRQIKIALNPATQAASLIPSLSTLGIEFDTFSTIEGGRACAWFQEAVPGGLIEHVGQPELDTAVANARVVTRGEAELWDKRDRTIDISPVVACSTAAYRWASRGEPDYDLLDSIF